MDDQASPGDLLRSRIIAVLVSLRRRPHRNLRHRHDLSGAVDVLPLSALRRRLEVSAVRVV